LDTTDVTRMRNHPERYPALALAALQRGYPLGRPMTLMERLSLAVSSTLPAYQLTITTVAMAQPELARAFGLLVPRIERRKARKRVPLIYIGVYAMGTGDAGAHLHLLLWERPYMPSWHGQTKALGLGNPHVERVAPMEPLNILRTVGYVLGQQEPVFGSRGHERHEPRLKNQRRFVQPQARTLEVHHRELFRATQLAKDQSVSDKTLFESLPTLNNKIRRSVTTKDIEPSATALMPPVPPRATKG
jgi:hypothetical protein